MNKPEIPKKAIQGFRLRLCYALRDVCDCDCKNCIFFHETPIEEFKAYLKEQLDEEVS